MDLIEAPDGVLRDTAANLETFRAALGRGDPIAASSVYHDAAVLVSPTGDVLSGRSAIERFWQSGIEVGLGSIELQPLLQSALGALVYELGRYRMRLGPATDQAAAERGRYVIVHVQSRGSWRWAVSAFGSAEARHERPDPTSHARRNLT